MSLYALTNYREVFESNRVSHYYLFIDESGTTDPTPRPQDNYLLLGGVLMKRNVYREAQEKLYSIKSRYWTHPDAINIHAADIRRRRNDFGRFQGRQAELQSLQEELVEYLRSLEFISLNSVIDKGAILSPSSMGDLYHKCLTFMLERTVYNVQYVPNVKLTVFAESRNPPENRNLQEFFNIALGNGVGAVKAASFKSIRPHLLIQPKTANITGLQIADLCVYTIRKHFETPTYNGIDWQVVRSKIKANPSGNINGWGLKVYP